MYRAIKTIRKKEGRKEGRHMNDVIAMAVSPQFMDFLRKPSSEFYTNIPSNSVSPCI